MVLESGRARVRLEASPIWCRRSSLAAYSFGGGVKPAGQNTGAWLAVLKFLADTAICPGFRGNIRCREGNRTSSAVKGRLWQRLATLRLARLRRSRPRFARHYFRSSPPSMPHSMRRGVVAPGSLTLAPPAVNGPCRRGVGRRSLTTIPGYLLPVLPSVRAWRGARRAVCVPVCRAPDARPTGGSVPDGG